MRDRSGPDGVAPPATRLSPMTCGLVGLAAAAVLWSALAPAAARRLPGRAPAELPSRLDVGFVGAVAALAEKLPPDTAVDIVTPPQREAMSSWYWTMAAFTAPGLVWGRAGGPGTVSSAWRMTRADTPPGRGWAPAACAAGWCVWRP